MSKIRLAGFVLATVFALPVAASPVLFQVTNPADSGFGTLRRAILDGNALPANDYPVVKIELGSNDPILLQSSLPLITKMIEIRGTQSTPAVINGLSQYALLHVDSSTAASMVQLRNLVLRVGRADMGGCLRIDDTWGIFIIDDVLFDGCSARSTQARGGAITANGGFLKITNSEFRGNVSQGESARGGAISLIGDYNDPASLLILHTRFDTNSAIAIPSDPGASYAYAKGGAIAVSNTDLNVEDSLFHANWAVSNNDAQDGREGGAIDGSHSNLTIRRSKFTFNRASEGGAIMLFRDVDDDVAPGLGFVLVNNTFVGNHAGYRGGAIEVGRSDVVLRNNSFFANAAEWSGNNFYGYTASVAPTYDFWNNLFTNSLPGSSCVYELGETNSGFNITPGDGCGLENQSSNLVTSDAHLQGYLLDAGWPFDTTATPLRFFVDSPALDASNPAAPDDAMVSACPELDGQGNPRAADGDADGTARCDIGAFEWQHEASLFANDFEDRLEPVIVGP